MVTIDDIRTQNLQVLVAQFDGTNKFAVLIGRTPAQVSQWLNRTPNSRTRKPRVISRESCRMVEEKTGRPSGWMDIDHSAASSALTGEGVYAQFRALALDERVQFFKLLAQGVS